MAMSNTLPKNQKESINDVQPSTVRPMKNETSVLFAMTRVIKSMRKPMEEMSRIGLVENEVIPSMAKLIILRKGYFDTPAKRSFRS